MTRAMRWTAVMALLALTSVSGGEPVTVRFFGSLPGQTGSRATAVSPDGYHVAVTASTASGEVAARWSPSLGLAALGVLPGDYSSDARAISRTGRIYGRSNGPSGSRAFLWTQQLGMVPFGEDPESVSPIAFARDVDVLTGGVLDQSTDAVIWTDGGPAVALSGPFGQFTDGNRTALACSADGSVVVGYADTSSGHLAFRWTAATGYQSLGTLPGGSVSTAWDVSPDGSFVVGASTDSTGAVRAFRWSAAGGMTLIAAPANVSGAVAYGVSSDGATIVGSCWVSNTPTTSPAQQAFFWRQQSGFVILSTYLAGLGLLPNGWLRETTGVSDDGQVFVGNGSYRVAGQDHYEGYMVRLAGAPPLCPADLGVQGGQVGHDGALDNNDFIAFISLYFLADIRADVGRQGGFSGSDGMFDNNDFIAFISAFFGGCP